MRQKLRDQISDALDARDERIAMKVRTETSMTLAGALDQIRRELAGRSTSAPPAPTALDAHERARIRGEGYDHGLTVGLDRLDQVRKYVERDATIATHEVRQYLSRDLLPWLANIIHMSRVEHYEGISGTALVDNLEDSSLDATET